MIGLGDKLKGYRKIRIVLYERNNFWELVQKTLAFEKARKEEMEKEQKNKRLIPSSS